VYRGSPPPEPKGAVQSLLVTALAVLATAVAIFLLT
jgi:hypothetical protein